ncbi:hypothetical protein [Sulfurimonas microaerophilic]|uniref:hypothetical protein n=1 Tax=Sulfurimonas microaerophilic TaxID=3058392 RepID=UPI0027151923|nr:hypothetical protein [Sulfurimonas sp. hsl 1-7]
MENHIYRDVLNLDDFNLQELDFSSTNYISYKENGIQFKNQDFSNTTLRIDKNFIDECKEEIRQRRFLTGVDFIIDIEFKNCHFSNIIIKEEIINANLLFDYDEQNTNQEIEKFILFGCTLNGKFYINKQYSGNNKTLTIKSLKIENTVFKSNFKLHKTVLKEFNIEDTDFEKHADFFKSIFHQGTLKKDDIEKINDNDIGFKAINFKGLALFGDTEFHKKLIFKYVTFESFSHFRKAKLFKGLDLDYSNIQNEMNFFDVTELDNSEAKNNTSQETFRIIKHNFTKIGNTIEANKYHALELKKRRNQLKILSADFFNYLVFFFHWISSNHSQYWVLPVLWILAIGYLTYLSLDSFVCARYGCSNNLIDMFKYISIINYDDCIKKNPIIFILNKVLLGYFYYQFIVSIRKDTRK